ncbi:MAG TPA: TonB family protein [Candidatus Acidoferrales bacterium]|nr:TonB family protein [Candidatus Acidoferrales bacterium]
MSGLTDVWKQFEGRVVDGMFPLQQLLGGSEHSAVFLTKRSTNPFQKAAIKLISAQVFSTGNIDEGAQLARWANSAKLSHAHLMHLFESGRGQIDDAKFLYVVMEYAEENLAQILPLRPLSPAEVKEMLPPTTEALAYLHQAGFSHGHIKPSNILAVDNQLKISADSLRKTGERDSHTPTPYDAPEVATTGPSPAADVWSLGLVLVAIMTQQGSQTINASEGWAKIPHKVPQPFYGIAQRCLRVDPRERCTVNEILGKPKFQTPLPAKAIPKPPAKRSNIWRLLPVVVAVILLAVLLGRRSHQPTVPPAQTTESPTASANAHAPQSPAPFDDKATPTQTGVARGKVLQEVSPEVSPGSRRTITGHVKVSVQVSVDTSGNVSQASLVSSGPSKYFANQALTAARRWKFTPARVNGQAIPSEWILRFQFGRTSTQVLPAETKP